jgi:tetratricopeptide (TPR) repeat protein
LIFLKRSKYDEASVFFELALVIREKYYNYFHVDIAMSLRNIAMSLTDQNKYDEALANDKQAMSIYKKYYPSGHVNIALTLSDMSNIFCLQKNTTKVSMLFSKH